ncbi:MAG: hypothetical protein AAFR26_14465 [Cyanobacteria bacterium J06626_4]
MSFKEALMRTTSKVLLISVGVGALLIATPRLAMSQSAGANREAIRSLNLSRSQMQELRGVMQGYQSELEDILTSEQQQQLADLKEEMQDESATDDRPDLVTELDLSSDQASQLDSLQTDMTAAVQGILSAEQFEEAQDLGLLGL